MIKRNNKEELIKLIKENPELPLVFFAPNNEFCPDYGSTVFNDFYAYIAEIYIDEDNYDKTYYDDLDEVIEIYSDRLCDADGFKDLFNEDFEKAIKEYVETNVEHYKAIVVSMRA